ncbi:accessory Sec system protein translocase subunit SecY2 [Streptococcus sp. zg-JUN1979]|uniref:accessory Sec system protein translocase subunit SecY2 n=1 Tax=Streptococcus sp. zg-JUN1979 TaxID=3391450 RepID=UPI0039A6732B
MLAFLRRTIGHSLLVQKLAWTLLIVFVYMLGQRIVVPTVPMDTSIFQDKNVQSLMESLSALSGAQLSSMTLFSLGLSPWMTSQILLRTLTVFDVSFVKHLTKTGRERFLMTLMLVIALIQAFGLTVSTPYIGISATGFYSEGLARGATILLLVTGSMVLTWLANMNTVKGLGGAIVIILTNMTMNLIANTLTYFSQQTWTTAQLFWQLGIFALAVFVLVMIAIITYRAEYRIAIKRVNAPLRSRLASAYIPIRINPAGAMPFMYGMTLMTLPPLIFSGLSNLFPNVSVFETLIVATSIQTVTGVLCYVLILYVLAVGFAYYNYEADDIADNMRNNGDYIEHIRPGEMTRRYLQSRISFFAQVGAVIVCVMGGGPMLISVLSAGQISLALLITNVYIIASFMLGLIEQVSNLRLWKKYKPLL